ncbi:MAG: hypothetical protein P8P74_03330 [Crocinitomicaceae bacterium]|nr:hypothetical protein [Crocinitomicaceae bacterium]
MTSEVRTLFLGILTLVVYAVSFFISDGSLIFPFPLNEFIFLAISIQFLYSNWTENRLAGFLPVIAGICWVLSTQFFWSFFHTQEQMLEFMDGLTTDYFLIAFYALILIGGIATMIKQRSGIALVLTGVFAIAFVTGVILNDSLLLLLGYGSMLASTQIKKVYAPYHLLWILLFVLKLTEWLTFFLNS